MRGGNNILLSLVIINNSLLRKKRSIIVPENKLNLEILSLCKTAGVVLTYYKLSNSRIKIIFFYFQGQPI